MSYSKQGSTRLAISVNCLASNQDIDEGLKPLLRVLERDSLLLERVERLMTIPAVGPIAGLTWALEVGDLHRVSSIRKAISYCGLCGAEKSSANITKRASLSKQRNKHPDHSDRGRQDGSAQQLGRRQKDFLVVATENRTAA